VQGRTQGHLGRLQIETARLAALLEDDAQELVYFPRDFPVDRFRRFFSWGLSVSSTGRARQIFALTSTKDRSNCRYRRKVSISRSALRCAAGVGKLSVIVLPFTL